jgi:hypothetical protein
MMYAKSVGVILDIKLSSLAVSSSVLTAPNSSTFFAGPATGMVVLASAVHSPGNPPINMDAVIALSAPAPVESTSIFAVLWPEVITPADVDQMKIGVTFGSPPVRVAVNWTGRPSFTGLAVGVRTSSFGHGETGGAVGGFAGGFCSAGNCAATQNANTNISAAGDIMPITVLFITKNLRY